jgi:hypothetical protein
MTEEQERMYDMLCELTAEQAVDMFLNYHGTQLLSEGFREYLMEDEESLCSEE